MKTTTIQLAVRTQVGTNPLGEPVYEEEWIDVPGVLVGLPSTTEITNAIEMYGILCTFSIHIFYVTISPQKYNFEALK